VTDKSFSKIRFAAKRRIQGKQTVLLPKFVILQPCPDGEKVDEPANGMGDPWTNMEL
jgi:hypothetical protein